MIVQQILQVSSLMDSVSYVHIPREWNRVANCLAKWASKNIDGWKINEWEKMPYKLCQDLERTVLEDVSGIGE